MLQTTKFKFKLKYMQLMSKLLTFHMNPLAKLSQLDMIALKKVLYQDRLLSKHPVVEVTITRLKRPKISP